MTLSGGWGVVTSYLCEMFGLQVPKLSPELIERIDKILPPYWSRVNPIDLVGENDPTLPKVVLEELMKWDGCDAIINLGIKGKRVIGEHLLQSMVKSDPSYSGKFIEDARTLITAFETEHIEHVAKLMDKYKKPVYGVSTVTDEKDKTVNSVEGCEYKSVFFPTPERAVKSLSRMAEYQQYLIKHV